MKKTGAEMAAVNAAGFISWTKFKINLQNLGRRVEDIFPAKRGDYLQALGHFKCIKLQYK